MAAWEGDKLTFLGDVKNPVAVGKKRDLWANLDDEFSQILDLWRWHRAGLININNLPYDKAIGIRYLVEVDIVERTIKL